MIGQCLDYLHQNNLVHLDLKPSIIIRIRDRMYLIDLDSCSTPSSETAGAKNKKFYGALASNISTGIFPPEMILKSKGRDVEVYEGYFKHTLPPVEEQEQEEKYCTESWIEKKVAPKKEGEG